MEHDEMYFVINGKAIMLDEMGAAVVCDVLENGQVDWDSFDLIDWMDLLPDQYQIYKEAVDFLQANATQSMYIK